MKKATLLLLPIASLGLLVGCAKDPETSKQYTVKFVNYDGTLLAEDPWNEGSTPFYEGDEPQRTDAPENHQYIYSGWDKEITKVTENTTYTATFDYVYLFGSYPQTLVTDADLIKKLDAITEFNAYGYKELTVGEKKCEYFMYTNKESYTANDGTHVQKNEPAYNYYLVEPIQWKYLLSEEKGDENNIFTTYKLLAVVQYDDMSKEPIQGDSHNRYDKSGLHNWLNDFTKPADAKTLGSFAWRAFTEPEYNSIHTTNVDNSDKSTCDSGNPYATNDPDSSKVFTLSRENLRSHGDKDYSQEKYPFTEDDNATTTRMARTTDFARAMGAIWEYWLYWTRSPSNDEWCFDDKEAYAVMVDGHISHYQINDNDICARPAIRFETI